MKPPPRYPYSAPNTPWQPVARHKPPFVVIGVLAAIVLALSLMESLRPPQQTAPTAPPRGTITDAQCRAVRIGMTSADVSAALGRPDIVLDGARPNWAYFTTTGGRLSIGFFEGRVEAAALDDAQQREVFVIAAPDAGIEVR